MRFSEASATGAGGRISVGERRNWSISPSLLFVVMNYLCFITFFMFLSFHLTSNNDNSSDNVWFIIFSPLVPVYVGLFSLHVRDLSKLRPNTPPDMKTKFYCSIADSISYFTSTLLLFLHLLNLSSVPVSFSVTLTPLYLISIVTLSIRFTLIPSPFSREWNQGYRHLFAFCVAFFNLLLRVVLPLLLIFRVDNYYFTTLEMLSWWVIFSPVWIVIVMCFLCSIMLLYNSMITYRNTLALRHHAANLMGLFSVQLIIGSIGALIASVRLIQKLQGGRASYLAVIVPVIVALFLLMILHPFTLHISKRYELPQATWRSREATQIGTLESISSAGGKIGGYDYSLSPLVLSHPIWLAEISESRFTKIPFVNGGLTSELDLSNIPSVHSPLQSRDEEEREPLSASVHEIVASTRSISTSDLMRYFSKESQQQAMVMQKDSPNFGSESDRLDERDKDSAVSHSDRTQLHEVLRSELVRSFATRASSSSGASDTAFLPSSLPHSNSPQFKTPFVLEPLSIPDSRLDFSSVETGELGVQLIVDRNRQRFVQRYLITSRTPIRRSFSLSSFDYANVLADTLQYVEEDRQSSLGGGGEHLQDNDDQSLELGQPDKYFANRFSPPHSLPFPQFEFPLSNRSYSLDHLDNLGLGGLSRGGGRVQTNSSVSCRSHDTPLSHHSLPINPYLPTGNSLCYICYVNESNACFMKCGHGGLCYSCAMAIAKQYTNQCPICRKESVEILKIAKQFSYTVDSKLYRFGFCEDGVQVIALGSPNFNNQQSRSSSHLSSAQQFSPPLSRTTSSRGGDGRSNSSGNNCFNSSGEAHAVPEDPSERSEVYLHL